MADDEIPFGSFAPRRAVDLGDPGFMLRGRLPGYRGFGRNSTAEMSAVPDAPSDVYNRNVTESLLSAGVPERIAEAIGPKFGALTQMVSPVGVATSVDDMRHYAERGDYPAMAMAAMGVVPGGKGVGKAAAKAFDFATPGVRTAKLGNTEVRYVVGKDGVDLDLIKTAKEARNQGEARAALTQMVSEADEAGKRITLSADPMESGVSKKRLEDFYKSAGFVRNAGRYKDFSTRAGFIREPQQSFGAMAPAEVAPSIIKPEGIRAYHGSPHDFDRFDISKVGTGEGAQSFGHGLYFAENEEVARMYRDALKGKSLYDHALPMDHPKNIAAELYDSRRGDFRGMFDDLTGYDNRGAIARELRALQRNPPTGRMYEVDINAQPESFLNWDRPLTGQTEQVRSVLGRLDAGLQTRAPQLSSIRDPEIRSVVREGLRQNEGEARDLSLMIDNDSRLYRQAVEHAKRRGVDLDANDMRASDYVYGQAKGFLDDLSNSQNLSGDALGRILGVKDADIMSAGMASAKIKEAGIPGIRYLDQGSRGAQTGTSNYVVFDPGIVDIMRKYALPGAAAFGSLAPGGGDGNY